MNAIEQLEEDAQGELKEHVQADIFYRLCLLDLDYLGNKAEHGKESRH